MTPDRLTARGLNRALLQRQLLLERSPLDALEAVEHVVGMQAQVPHNPYVGLWSRLSSFDPDHLAQLLVDRKVVRAVLMRGTIHLATAADCLHIRRLVQPVLDAELNRHQDYGPIVRDLDLDPIAEAGRTVLEQARTNTQLRAALAERFPGVDPGALAYVCRNQLCLVQVPPRGLWGRSGQVTTTTAEAWLGRALADDPSIDNLMLRYLAAFGPATVADAGTWIRLSGLGEVFERMRPRLRVLTDERGRRLFDCPDGVLPDPDTPAPPRFLPEYDNVLLSHADRTRVVAQERSALVFAAGRPGRGTVLSDGFLGGSWVTQADRSTGTATLLVDLAGPMTRRAVAAIEREGRALVRFLHAGASDHEVRTTVMA